MEKRHTYMGSAQKWRKLVASAVSLALAVPWGMLPAPAQAQTVPQWNLSPVPLYMSVGSTPNVLLIMDNSNSMDERPDGSAAGSASPESKSEIARGVAKNLVANYTGRINMGLMAYQQSSVISRYIYESPYDLSYNPANYDPNLDLTVVGARAGQMKKFRMANPSDPSNYIYFNVSLPMYSDSNAQTSYCYSTTANAAPTPQKPTGFGLSTDTSLNNYTCYARKTGTSDALAAAGGGYSGSSYGSHYEPTDSDFAQDIYVFGYRNASIYVGPTWFSDTWPGRGYLHVPVKPLDATHAAKIDTKLGTSQFATNAPTGASYPLQNAGNTPIAGTLLTARDYYGASMGTGAWTNTAEGYAAGCYAPNLGNCGHNYVILLTDGLPSTTAAGTQITNSAAALTEAANAAGSLLDTGVKTYIVGFALPVGVDPAQLDTIAAAGGTGTAYLATDMATLSTVLDNIFTSIMAEAGSSATVAASSSSFMEGSNIFQTGFSSSSWKGELAAFPITGSAVSTAATWKASEELPLAANRTILTYKPSNGNGIAFRWPGNATSPTASELDPSQVSALGSASMLNYIRGDSSNEGYTGGMYRVRDSKLGDFVNSAPVYVGPAMESYDEWDSAYRSFKTSQQSRAAMLYVGGNDGMLHGFSATSGAEKMAYVPSTVFGNLPLLADQNYNALHKYFVDGSPAVADVMIGATPAWRTVLVGGLNAGGQGYYALDVTDPGAFSEGNPGATVLWEFADRNFGGSGSGNANFDADLGYTYGMATMGKMHDGSWVAIFGNGLNNTVSDGAASTTGNAVLYIVDVGTGKLIKKLDTGKGVSSSSNNKPNGLASPAAVDVDHDGVIDYVYAGDLQGNMWKFDVTGSTPSSWTVAYSGAPLFTTIHKDLQPITTRPEVARGLNGGGLMVYFGTGKYFETTVDSDPGAQTRSQAFYGIWDKGSAIANATDLVEQTVIGTATATTGNYRVVSDHPVDPATKLGWYLVLPTQGERQVTNAVLVNDTVVFTTLIPEQGECSAGGSSWLMEIDRKTGGRLSYTFTDVNGDDFYDVGDQVTAGGETAYVGGWQAAGNSGIYSAPLVLPETGQHQVKIMSTSSGAMETLRENNGRPTGWLSWRELLID